MVTLTGSGVTTTRFSVVGDNKQGNVGTTAPPVSKVRARNSSRDKNCRCDTFMLKVHPSWPFNLYLPHLCTPQNRGISSERDIFAARWVCSKCPTQLPAGQRKRKSGLREPSIDGKTAVAGLPFPLILSKKCRK